jgi:hypothetical protein
MSKTRLIVALSLFLPAASARAGETCLAHVLTHVSGNYFYGEYTCGGEPKQPVEGSVAWSEIEVRGLIYKYFESRGYVESGCGGAYLVFRK